MNSYQSYIFDCDGVILDSNNVKTEACRKIAEQYGREVAIEFVAYHQQNAGISRFRKIRYLHEALLDGPADESRIEQDIAMFGTLVAEILKQTPFTSGFEKFITTLPDSAKKYVVSGGAETEVHAAMVAKGLGDYFDGVYGSPKPKDEIIREIIDRNDLPYPGVYFGDSKFDSEMADLFQFDFVFLSQYSEFGEWEKYFAGRDVKIIGTFDELT